MTCPNCPEGYDCESGNYYTGANAQCPHCISPRREWRFEMPNGDRVENCGNAWHDGVQAVGWR